MNHLNRSDYNDGNLEACSVCARTGSDTDENIEQRDDPQRRIVPAEHRDRILFLYLDLPSAVGTAVSDRLRRQDALSVSQSYRLFLSVVQGGPAAACLSAGKGDGPDRLCAVDVCGVL